MKKSRFTEEQIVFALKQAELGTSVPEVCRKLGISDATFYTWRKKYGGISPSELKHMRQLEEENLRLKRLVADLSLDKAMLQCKHTRFSSTHFLRFPVFQPSAGTLPASGYSGIHEAARCCIPSASAL